MINIITDPASPDRLVLTATCTLYIDKLMLEALSDELTAAIRAQAKKDLLSNPAVKKAIAKAATEKLLEMLGVPEVTCTHP